MRLPLLVGVAALGALQLAAGPVLRIMPLGDSITCGNGSDGTAGYRGLLWNKLKTAGYAVDYVGTQTTFPAAGVPDMDVDHEGHGGWLVTDTTEAEHGVFGNLPLWLGQVEVPDVVLVHLGTNDSGESDFGEQGVLDMEKTLEILRSLAPDAHIVLSSLMWRSDAARYANIQKFNARLGGLVTLQRARGQKVSLVDMHAAVTGGETNFTDGLHPNATGYGLMADAWLGAIRAIYPDPQTLAEAAVDVAPSTDAYVESQGGRWVNLGYFMTPKSRIEVDFQYPKTPTGGILFGPWADEAKLCTAFWNNQDGGNCKYGFILSDNTMKNRNSSCLCDTVRHVAVIDVLARSSSLLTDGQVTWTGSVNADVTCNNTARWPIVLFGATADADGNGKQTVSARIYSVKIYEDGKLVHDYLPACKGRDPGFLDALTGTFKYGQGSGDLALSGDYLVTAEDGYVESSAVNEAGPSVNTGYFMTPKSRIEVDFQYPTTPTGGILFGPWEAGAKLSTMCWNCNEKFSFSYGNDGHHDIRSSIALDDRRHTAVVDVLHNRLSLLRNGCVQWSSNDVAVAHSNTAVWPVVVFGATKAANGRGGQCVSARIFSVKIYENDLLVRNYVPCQKGDFVGLRETKTGVFLANSAPGMSGLVAGGAIERIADDGYIVSDGTDKTGISIGYHMNPAARIEVDYAPLANKWNGKFVFGSWTDEPTLRTLLWHSGNEVHFILKDGTTFETVGTGLKGDTSRHTAVIDGPSGGFAYVSGVTTNWTGRAGAAPRNTSTHPIALFASTSGDGSSFATTIGAKIYSVKIYENDGLVKNLLPYVKNGNAGFRDALNGDFFCEKNSNVRHFTAGGNVACDESDAYVESDGTQVLNTGYFATTDSRIEVDFQVLDMSSNQLIYGAWSAGTGIRFCSWYNGGVFTSMLGGGGKSPNTALGALDLSRHTSVIDIPKLTFSLLTEGQVTYAVAVTDTGLTEGEKDLHPMGVFGGISNAEGTTKTMSGKMRIFAVRIYESERLAHEFLPYKNGADVGLCDVKTGKLALKHSATVENPKIGGCGWGPDHAAFYTEPANGTVPVDGKMVLKTFAPGAVRYQWYRDGQEIVGAIGPELTVSWKRLGAPADYAVKAMFDCSGAPVERMSRAATVDMERKFMAIIVR